MVPRMLCYSPLMLCISGVKRSGVHLRPDGRDAAVLFFEIHPAITLSTNNRITLCSYFLQLCATLCEQLHAIVHKVKRFFYEFSKLRNAMASLHVTITACLLRRNFDSWTEATCKNIHTYSLSIIIRYYTSIKYALSVLPSNGVTN